MVTAQPPPHTPIIKKGGGKSPQTRPQPPPGWVRRGGGGEGRSPPRRRSPEGDPNRSEPGGDSPLCSPRNTSLNFRSGLPKSPPADMMKEPPPPPPRARSAPLPADGTRDRSSLAFLPPPTPPYNEGCGTGRAAPVEAQPAGRGVSAAAAPLRAGLLPPRLTPRPRAPALARSAPHPRRRAADPTRPVPSTRLDVALRGPPARRAVGQSQREGRGEVGEGGACRPLLLSCGCDHSGA